MIMIGGNLSGSLSVNAFVFVGRPESHVSSTPQARIETAQRSSGSVATRTPTTVHAFGQW